MSQVELFANLSPLNTVVSKSDLVDFLIFQPWIDSRVEIVSSFNGPIYLFSVAIPKGENVINVTFPFFWFGSALIVGLISFQFLPWKYWQMALLFSYPKRFHVFFKGSSPQWIKTNFLQGLSQAFPWGNALGAVLYDWGTFRMFLILYSFLFLDAYLCTTFCDNPNVYKRIVHPLLISHLHHNYNLVNNLCSLSRCYEARHHLVVRLKTFEGFNLLICTIACLQN